MFGTLRPHGCSLPPADKEAQGRLYCGLCKALGDGYGQASRGLLSHDAVFLAALVDALADEAAPPDTARCPLLPVHHRKTVAPTSLAMTFASGFQLLLAEQWLLDRALDGSPWLRAAHGLLAGRAVVARERLAAIGADTEPLLGFEGRQKAAEVWGADPDDVAAPTAEALAHVFRSVADVTGRADARDALSRLGAGVGRAIYLIDALEDLAKDARTGQFNACLDPDEPTPSAARVGAARRSLSRALRDIEVALGELPLARHRELLEATLVARLPQRARLAAREARAALPGPASPERRAALGWAAAVWAWLMLWLPAPWAAAQDRPNRDRPRLDRPKPGDPPRPKPEPAPRPRPTEPEPEPEPEEPPTDAQPAPCCLDDGSCCDCGSSCNQDCERCCNDCEACCDCGETCDLQGCCDECCAENDDCCTGCSVQQGRVRLPRSLLRRFRAK